MATAASHNKKWSVCFTSSAVLYRITCCVSMRLTASINRKNPLTRQRQFFPNRPACWKGMWSSSILCQEGMGLNGKCCVALLCSRSCFSRRSATQQVKRNNVNDAREIHTSPEFQVYFVSAASPTTYASQRM